MTIEEAVAELTAMNEPHADNEIVHGRADEILLEFVPKEIAEAYNRLRDEIGFWYA